MNEFDLIAKYFAPLAPGGLSDDAAVLSVPAGQALVVSSDTLNAGTHFPEDAAPEFIAQKALRVNLSDLAAMGADPYAYQLNIAFPEAPSEAWLEAFTKALAEDQKQFGIICSGGDTTRIKGPLSISITAMGLVPEGQAVRRGGAQERDLVVVTGSIGEAIVKNYNHIPTPRLDLAETIRSYANAAIDVSDGLVADLGHICKASSLGAVVELDKVPFAKTSEIPREALLTGGEDYELLLAVPEAYLAHFKDAHVIGRFEAGDGVKILDEDGNAMTFEHTGWSHF